VHQNISLAINLVKTRKTQKVTTLKYPALIYHTVPNVAILSITDNRL